MIYTLNEFINDLQIVTDNVGVAAGFGSASSKCLLAHSVIKALHDVSRALNVTLTVSWRRRCSDEMTTLVDQLSKGDSTLTKAFHSSRPGYTSRTLALFMKDPRPQRCLGVAIAEELSSWMETLDCHVEWKDSYEHLVRYPKNKFSEN